MKLSPDTGRLFFKSSTGNKSFFISGVTTVFLNPSGTSPSWSEQLTNLVIDGRRMSIHSLIRNVGNGSNMHDLVVDLKQKHTFLTLILIVSYVTSPLMGSHCYTRHIQQELVVMLVSSFVNGTNIARWILQL